jgi:hypothetical protein
MLGRGEYVPGFYIPPRLESGLSCRYDLNEDDDF